MGYNILAEGIASTTKEVIMGAGKGIGSLMDRFGFVEKLSEKEKADATIEASKIGLEEGKTDVEDVNSARQMAMTFINQNKLPRFLVWVNGAYRPLCGYIAMLYLTEGMWGFFLKKFFEGWYLPKDDVTSGVMGIIIFFFFGYRQRTKEKQVGGIG